ncbi:pantetheine-phosphate adenylyltransferase [Sulfurospirillum diekertiae]|uniref:Phosphopantetheine adenylyltransferase n=1 Tax=Sulfurospirillum diekertiae TaxID=1854492 RepID=A0A1Y0HNT5_9BACT|nr:pantetheine-phosphate adenylyltransferase [Sulfurospirillum diekertiae]ARU48873.1 Phosphopantetheine adenylyltransferase [Sulfurospirillum diekertiae]ASC93693.1 Phosphopantetheine adenylyltransferase [Sulfurospirillum diekertiae]QIR74811.1 pantetheine-phosphate adenylyltransferase [Sulfurospirillum diekertiae]QIR77475.1 pantetheine-phosphate adenylyltransferase [Sulfurospirillum diekertiae]
MRVAIYPGTFDPITNGHMDVIKRAQKLFDKVLVAVALSEEKHPVFDINTRVEMVQAAIKDMDGVEVEPFDNLLVSFSKEKNIRVMIRGLRAVSDFEFELQMGYANASLWSEIETVYLMPSLKNAFISSSVVRSIVKHGGDVSHLVPPMVLPYLQSRFTCM